MATDKPDGWVEIAFLPREKYRLSEDADGWHVLAFDEQQAYVAGLAATPQHGRAKTPGWDTKTRCLCGAEFNTLREFDLHESEAADAAYYQAHKDDPDEWEATGSAQPGARRAVQPEAQ